MAIKNSHILDGNSLILRELELNPPPTNISNAKPAVKTDPKHHSLCKRDENCMVRSPKSFGKTLIRVRLAASALPPRTWRPRTKLRCCPRRAWVVRMVARPRAHRFSSGPRSPLYWINAQTEFKRR